MAPSEWLKAEVLGLPVHLTPHLLGAAEALVRSGGHVVTLNAEMTMAARNHAPLRRVIQGSELVIPDGAGVVWALRLQGHRLRRQPGIELAEMLLGHAAALGWRVAWVGARDDRLQAAARFWKRRHPQLRLQRLIHGYQPPDHWPMVEADLRRQQPELVFVGLGAPRQELWIDKARPRGHGLWLGVGGSFDVWSGSVRRAPAFMQALQLEWFYRLLQEPGRWPRILQLPVFSGHVLMERGAALLSESRRRPARQRPTAGRTGESAAECPPVERRADKPPEVGPG